MIAAGYSMHLYCDALGDNGLHLPPHQYSEFPHEFTGQTYGECARAARANGWRFKHNGHVICPKCNRRPAPSATASGDQP